MQRAEGLDGSCKKYHQHVNLSCPLHGTIVLYDSSEKALPSTDTTDDSCVMSVLYFFYILCYTSIYMSSSGEVRKKPIIYINYIQGGI